MSPPLCVTVCVKWTGSGTRPSSSRSEIGPGSLWSYEREIGTGESKVHIPTSRTGPDRHPRTSLPLPSRDPSSTHILGHGPTLNSGYHTDAGTFHTMNGTSKRGTSGRSDVPRQVTETVRSQRKRYHRRGARGVTVSEVVNT